MQCSAAVRATCRKQQIPQLWMEGRGGVLIVLFSELTPFEDNVPTILSQIFRLTHGWLCIGYLPFCREIIGTLNNYDNDGSENITKKWICVLSNFIASIWNRSIRQMLATFSGVAFLRALSMLKFVVVCPRPPYNVALGGFTSKSCSGRQELY